MWSFGSPLVFHLGFPIFSIIDSRISCSVSGPRTIWRGTSCIHGIVGLLIGRHGGGRGCCGHRLRVEIGRLSGGVGGQMRILLRRLGGYALWQ